MNKGALALRQGLLQIQIGRPSFDSVGLDPTVSFLLNGIGSSSSLSDARQAIKSEEVVEANL